MVHMYTRDGVYKGTITDPLIVSRAVKNWRDETVPAIKLFFVMIAECFPEKLLKLEISNLPEWHPYLPNKDENSKRKVPFISGPHIGIEYVTREIYTYLMLNEEIEFGDACHLYKLQLDPTISCGYVHVLSGSREEVNRYCIKNEIRCLRGG